MAAYALQDAIGGVLLPYDLVNDPSPKVPPGLQPKIELLLAWGKWACLILDIAGILICAGKLAIGQSGRSHYAAEGASELPKVLGVAGRGRRTDHHGGLRMSQLRNGRRWMLDYGGVGAVLLVAVVLLSVTRWSSSADRVSTVPSAPAGQAHAVPSASADPAEPGMDMRGWRWADFHGVRLPYSSSDGPQVVTGDRAYGFAPSPAGALLAALHLGMRASRYVSSRKGHRGGYR